jgi:putative salt-induced outer membrane protein
MGVGPDPWSPPRAREENDVRNAIIVTLSLACAGLSAAPVMAQAPTPPTGSPPAVTGNVGIGLGVTSGNKDTTNFNAGYEFTYDPKTKNVVKSTGLFLYGQTDGELTNEQYGLSARDEYSVRPRAFVFGEVRYLHDRFKGIEYLITPTGGVGYKLMDDKVTTLAVSAGLGGVWERDYDVDLKSNGAVSLDEKLSLKLSAAAAVNQSFAALWNIEDFGDALYIFGLNLTASVVGKAQVKVEVLDTYKTRPPLPTLQGNDVAFITGIVYKF